MTSDQRRRILSGVAFPLLVGGSLYLVARHDGLRMFAWADALGLHHPLHDARAGAASTAAELPAWVLYSLPDALWAFALMRVFCIIWKDRLTRASAPWLASAAVIAIGSELGQAAHVVPGTFDPVDLALLVVGVLAGAWPLARRRESTAIARTHGFSFVALVFMLVLAGGSQKPTPAEVEAGLAAAAGDKKILDDYVDKIGAVYKSLSATNMNGLHATRCDEAAMLKAAPPKKDDYGKLHLQRVFGPFMARFASKNAADWKKYDYSGTWDWLTEGNYGGHFSDFPSTRDSYAIKDTARRVKEEFIPSRYIVVIWPTSSKNTMPIYHPKNESFVAGYFEGVVFVVDAIDNKVMCHAPLTVESGDLITYRTRGLLREKPETALKDDFENRMKKELTSALPDAVDFGTMGTIF